MTDVARPLDESLYYLDEEETAFLKSQTGITDDEEFRKHVLRVQAEIYAAHPYPCILYFGFAKLKISRLPAYQELLRLGREREGAIYLEMGCCVGNDLRKAVADGFPAHQTIASDLRPEYWEMGHQLFKSTRETFSVPFIPGNVFDPHFLELSPIPTATPSGPTPPLDSLTLLTPLVGRVSAVHTSAFFHLFPEEKQPELARTLAPLLLPEPGSIIFGEHVGLPQKGHRKHKNTHGIYMFCHSPESWKELWETQVFKPGQVRVDAYLREVISSIFLESRGYQLVWCVTRL